MEAVLQPDVVGEGSVLGVIEAVGFVACVLCGVVLFSAWSIMKNDAVCRGENRGWK